jgi:hypothetical protein
MDGDFGEDGVTPHEAVRLSEEELAAVEGWRQANRLASRSNALR